MWKCNPCNFLNNYILSDHINLSSNNCAFWYIHQSWTDAKLDDGQHRFESRRPTFESTLPCLALAHFAVVFSKQTLLVTTRVRVRISSEHHSSPCATWIEKGCTWLDIGKRGGFHFIHQMGLSSSSIQHTPWPVTTFFNV